MLVVLLLLLLLLMVVVVLLLLPPALLVVVLLLLLLSDTCTCLDVASKDELLWRCCSQLFNLPGLLTPYIFFQKSRNLNDEMCRMQSHAMTYTFVTYPSTHAHA